MVAWKIAQDQIILDCFISSFPIVNSDYSHEDRRDWEDENFSRIGFSLELLESLKGNLPANIQQFYLSVFERDKLIAISSFQKVDFAFGDYVSPNPNSKICKKLWFKGFIRAGSLFDGQIWVLGHTMLTGIQPYWIDEKYSAGDISEEGWWRNIMESIPCAELPATKKLKALALLKTGSGSVENRREWETYEIEPVMALEIRSNWNTIGDYESALRSKYRKKIRSVIRNTNHLTVHSLSYDLVLEYEEKMINFLYELLSNTEFNLIEPQGKFFSNLVRQKGVDYHIEGVFSGSKLVGFVSSIIHPEITEGHYLGYDRKIAGEVDLYKFLLYVLVKKAIQNKSKMLYFGRTASIVKTNFGAVPEASKVSILPKSKTVKWLLPMYYKMLYQSNVIESRNTFKD